MRSSRKSSKTENDITGMPGDTLMSFLVFVMEQNFPPPAMRLSRSKCPISVFDRSFSKSCISDGFRSDKVFKKLYFSHHFHRDETEKKCFPHFHGESEGAFSKSCFHKVNVFTRSHLDRLEEFLRSCIFILLIVSHLQKRFNLFPGRTHFQKVFFSTPWGPCISIFSVEMGCFWKFPFSQSQSAFPNFSRDFPKSYVWSLNPFPKAMKSFQKVSPGEPFSNRAIFCGFEYHRCLNEQNKNTTF